MNQRGLTLIEVLIASGISAAVLLFIFGQNISFFSHEMYDVTRSNLAQDSLLSSNYFNQQIQQVGGGAVRAYMSVWIDNQCPARTGLPSCLPNSDRLTLVSSSASPIDCTIVSQPSANSVVLQNTSPCCTAATFVNSAHTGSQLMLVLNNAYSQVYATAALSGACVLTYAAGQASPNDSTQGVTNWTGGTVSVVQVQTYYVDPTTNQLQVFSDLDHSGLANSTNLQTVLNNIFDLQAALGVDLNGDGKILDSNSTSDEWLYNAPNDLATFPAYNVNQIEMIEVGIISGTPANFENSGRTQVVQLLDGPDRQAAVLGKYDLTGLFFKSATRNR